MFSIKSAAVLPLLLLFFSNGLAAQNREVVFVSGTGESLAEETSRSDESAAPESRIAEAADKLSDPVVQDEVAASIERLTGAMIRLPVGRFVEAIETARPGTVKRRLDSNATLADIAGNGAQDIPNELGHQSREMMGTMSGFARAIAAMMPEFERMGREIEESVRDAKAAARRN